MTVPPTVNRLAIGTKVTVAGAGRLIGLIVDYAEKERYIVAFPKGLEFNFDVSKLILLKK